jgi:transcription elongation factor Elf1
MLYACHSVQVSETLIERRKNRLVIPPCLECGAEQDIRVTVRTDYVIYVRCGTCGFVWSEAKPGVPRLRH